MSALVMQLKQDGDERSYDSLIRWSLFSSATSIVALLLVAAALFAVANRVAGFRRTLLVIAGSLHLAYLAWILGRPFLMELLGTGRLQWLEGYGWKIIAFVFWTATLLIAIAARAWWRPATPWVVVAAVVGVVGEAVNWLPYVNGLLEDLSDSHPYAYRLFWPLREALTSGALLVMIHGILREAPPALPAPNRAAEWMRRAGASLMVRVIAAIALAVLTIGILKSPGMMKYVLVLGPALSVLAIVAFAWSVLGVDRAELPAMPRIRLTLGAALVTMSAALQMNQLVAAFRMFTDRDSFYAVQEAEMWSVIGPLISIVGMVLACSAIASWASRTGNLSIREMAVARAIVHAVLSVLVLLAPLVLGKATSSGAILGIALLAAIAAIVSIVVVATVFHRAADAVLPSPTLPEARLR